MGTGHGRGGWSTGLHCGGGQGQVWAELGGGAQGDLAFTWRLRDSVGAVTVLVREPWSGEVLP